MTWADPAARLAELAGLGDLDRPGVAQLPALTSDELLRLRWAVQLGMATTVENRSVLGDHMLAVLASLDTAIAEAWHSLRPGTVGMVDLATKTLHRPGPEHLVTACGVTLDDATVGPIVWVAAERSELLCPVCFHLGEL